MKTAKFGALVAKAQLCGDMPLKLLVRFRAIHKVKKHRGEERVSLYY